MVLQTVSSGWYRTSPSSSPQTKPTGRPQQVELLLEGAVASCGHNDGLQHVHLSEHTTIGHVQSLRGQMAHGLSWRYAGALTTWSQIVTPATEPAQFVTISLGPTIYDVLARPELWNVEMTEPQILVVDVHHDIREPFAAYLRKHGMRVGLADAAAARASLAKFADAELIKSVWGDGYQFAADVAEVS
jgi:hypothetical protein